ncbi:MAG: hypothetical protein HQK93_06875 [Nitrospirae bacterium]|nr:hypothetical protein [Nitrospirota bacterium]
MKKRHLVIFFIAILLIVSTLHIGKWTLEAVNAEVDDYQELREIKEI